VRSERLLLDWPEIIEIIPRAGRLRIRLQAGARPEELMAGIRQAVTAQGLTVSALGPARPELEDVFVAVLEETDR
jgi:hypothetical protein